MRRIAFLIVGLAFMAVSVFTFLHDNSVAASGKKDKKANKAPVKIEVTTRGPGQADFDRAKQFIVQHPDVKNLLNGTHNRLLSLEMIDSDNKGGDATNVPTRYRASFYDYTNNQMVIAEGNFDLTGPVSVRTQYYQPPVDTDEFNEAVSIVKRDAYFGRLLRDGKVVPYEPMPPVYEHKSLNKVERVVNVGLEPTPGNSELHEIVGVNIGRATVVRYESKAPPASRATTEASCGLTASSGSISRGVAGSYNLVISQSGTELWNMTVNRPSSSSGTDGSGIELIDVKYRGKLVLKRAHIPILNVQYVNGCGPFRDWQYSETWFKTDNSPEVAPGIKISSTPAQTIVDDRNDTGNYRGVAIYTQGDETVLVTELSAGWYRYINEWRFGNDGTIRPRYGFGSTTNSCVCLQRNHHVYWRLDFDLNGTNNSVSHIFPAQQFQKALNPLETELKQYRPTENKVWLISNPATRDSWLITPGDRDGTAQNDSFGAGDFWVLRYKTFPAEVDDGGGTAEARIDPFLNSESINNQDIVIWYAAHVTRSDDTSRPETLSGQYVVGPTIRPVKW